MGCRIFWDRSEGEEFPDAIAQAFARLEEFAELPVGWDGYGGRPLDAAAAPTIVSLILDGHRKCAPLTLHPLGGGGVAMSWVVGGRELEVQVAADGSLEALYENRATGEEIELPPQSDRSEVSPLFEKLFAAQ